MAIKRCKCGTSKAVNPPRSSAVIAFTCDYCLGLKERPRYHNTEIIVSSFVMVGEKKEVFAYKPRTKRA